MLQVYAIRIPREGGTKIRGSDLANAGQLDTIFTVCTATSASHCPDAPDTAHLCEPRAAQHTRKGAERWWTSSVLLVRGLLCRSTRVSEIYRSLRQLAAAHALCLCQPRLQGPWSSMIRRPPSSTATAVTRSAGDRIRRRRYADFPRPACWSKGAIDQAVSPGFTLGR